MGEAQRPELRFPLDAARGATRGTDARIFASLVIALGLAACAPIVWWARVAVGLALILVAWGARRRRGASARAPRGWVLAGEDGVLRTDGTSTTRILSWDEPLGLTVLTNRARTRALLAFTTSSQTRFVSVRVGGADDAAAAGDLFARAVVLADDDVAMGTHGGSEGDAWSFGPKLRGGDAAKLLRLVASRSPGALDRIHLSDPRGTKILLELASLTVGDRVFDLTSPLEWRAFTFDETGTHLTTLYAATWVRQGPFEIVIVSPMPEELTSAMLARGPSSRDAPRRKTPSLYDGPPAKDLRVAVERLFMVPLRAALARAPRISRADPPSRGKQSAAET